MQTTSIVAGSTTENQEVFPEKSKYFKFKFAVNTCGKDKTWDFKLLTTRYTDKEGTLEDVKRHVAAGHALCAGLLGGKSRSKANVVGSHWILLDIDNSAPLLDESGKPVKDENGKAISAYKPDLALDAALAHPFIQKYCALIYTTASHKTDWHKFRLIFLLPEYVEGADTVEACTRFLMQHLPHDPACKDASRVFYGNSKAEFPLMQPGVSLPMEWVEEARAIAQEERIIHAERVKQISERKAELRARNAKGWDIDALIQEALSFIPPRSPGSNNYDECRQVLMALTDYYGSAQAEVIGEQWSPSIRGTTWNVAQKIRSFKRGGIAIGTLFHIAKQYGFKFPAAVLQHKGETGEDWEKGLDRYLNSQKLEIFLGKTLKQVKTFVSQAPKYLGVKGFEQKSAPKSDDGIIYFKKGDRQKVVSQLALKAKEEGRKLRILDISETGSGKSHEWGELPNELLGIEKLFYTSPGHRNPTTLTVEQNFGGMVVRHNGLYEDESKPKTPLGNNHVRWAKREEKPNTQPNCKNTELFHIFADKGYHDAANATASINPICGKCQFRLGCFGAKDKDGKPIMPPVPGYTYILEREEVLRSYGKIRSSLDSLPSVKSLQEPNEEGEGGLKVGIIVDEFHTQYTPTNLTQVSLAEFDSTWMFFKTRESSLRDVLEQIRSLVEEKRKQLDDPTTEQDIKKLVQEIADLMDEHQRLKGLLARLPGALETVESIIYNIRSILNGEFLTTRDTFYGWSELHLRELIGELPAGLKDASEVLEALNPKISNLLSDIEADSVSQKSIQGGAKDKKGSSKTLNFVRGVFRRTANQEKRDRIKNLPTNCIVPLLKTLAGERGSFRIQNGNLEVVTSNNRHKEQLLTADLAVILDATLSPQALAESLEIDPSEIVVICEERKSYQNLTIKHVKGLGKLTRQRSGELEERLEALLEKLEQKHPNCAVIDHLACKRDGDGHWFVDSRGSNAYQHKETLIAIGSPYQDIGWLAMLYSTATGDKNAYRGNPKFDAFVQEFKESEVIQAGGRLRAHRRPDEQLTWYVVTDEDINYLKSAFPGAAFEEVTAFSINPDAGAESERTFSTILEALAKLAQEEGREKFTQGEVAQVANLAQSTISKRFSKNELIAKMGGWKGFRKIFQALIDIPRGWNNLSKKLREEFGEDASFTIQTYLPQFLRENENDMEVVARECIQFAQNVGWKAIQAFLHLMPFESRVNMLSWLMGQLNEDWRSQFLEIAQP